MVYHNITPPEYFVGVNARVADRCRRGRWELARLRNVTELALGVSEFNRQELESLGFPRTAVLPLLVDTARLTTAEPVRSIYSPKIGRVAATVRAAAEAFKNLRLLSIGVSPS